MSAGSYIRFVVGLVLSVTVLASFIAKESTTTLSAMLAMIFLVLAAAWAVFRF